MSKRLAAAERIVTTRAPKILGERGGFITTRGQPRFAQLNGKPYVVGRGQAHECPSIPAAYALRDRLLDAEKTARQTQRTATRAAVEAERPAEQAGFEVGQLVGFEITPGNPGRGHVAEIGARSIAIDTPGGCTYRRAPADVWKVQP